MCSYLIWIFRSANKKKIQINKIIYNNILIYKKAGAIYLESIVPVSF